MPIGDVTRVAVVIPCHNDGATVAEAVESARSETPGEVVVVDDGSSDGETLQALEALARRGIHVVRQEQRGLAGARMAGVAATTAPYIFPLDADDVLAPGALSVLAEALDRNPEAAAAWGDLEIFGEFEAKIDTADDLDPWLLTFIDDVPAWGLLRREALLSVGGWTLEAGNEDWDLWLALAARGWHGIHVARVTVRYRRHGHRLSATWLANRDDHVVTLRRRHAELLAQRRSSWRRSKAPWRVKLLFPLIDALPLLSGHDKYRVYLLVRRPRQHLRVRRLRRAAERRMK